MICNFFTLHIIYYDQHRGTLMLRYFYESVDNSDIITLRMSLAVATDWSETQYIWFLLVIVSGV